MGFFFFDRFYLQLQIKCKIYGTDMKKNDYII